MGWDVCSTLIGEHWKTPVAVVASCTDIPFSDKSFGLSSAVMFWNICLPADAETISAEMTRVAVLFLSLIHRGNPSPPG